MGNFAGTGGDKMKFERGRIGTGVIPVPVYRVAQKWHNFLYALTSSKWFSKLFHCHNQEKICKNTITEDPTTPQVCRYTIYLVNVKCLPISELRHCQHVTVLVFVRWSCNVSA